MKAEFSATKREELNCKDSLINIYGKVSEKSKIQKVMKNLEELGYTFCGDTEEEEYGHYSHTVRADWEPSIAEMRGDWKDATYKK